MTTATNLAHVEQLCAAAFGDGAVSVSELTDANRGRGAFSVVLRARLQWHGDANGPTDSAGDSPASVVAKLPIPGPNGQAAIGNGSYRRESLAYRQILVDSPIATPRMFAIDDRGDGSCSLLLEDLTGHRSVDQLDGLAAKDAATVAEALSRFHRAWADGTSHTAPADRTEALAVRRNTIAGLPDAGLQAGLATLDTVWAADLSDADRGGYEALVAARPRLAELFERAPATLCHGDPRADNLAFDRDDHVVLFDWQQMAWQLGEADLAWLTATSMEPDLRRAADRDLVDAYGGMVDRYRLGLALPGLAVLFLAQRELATERTRRFVAASLQRIAAAIRDWDVADLGS